MKKTRATALLLATVMTLTAVPSNVMAGDVSVSNPVAAETQSDVVTSEAAAEVNTSDSDLEAMALDGWITGWTGVDDQADDVSYQLTDDGIRMRTLKDGIGKLSNSEDSLAYYAFEAPATADFTLSATVTVNAYNSMGSSNTQQSSFGLFVFDDLYSKAATPPKTYTNGVILGSYRKSNATATSAITSIHRYNGVRTADQNLIEGLPITSNGSDMGPFEMEIQKSGDTVRVAVDGIEYSYNTAELATRDDMPYFADTIYLGMYIARDADITFSNVSYDVETRIVSGISVAQMPDKTVYTVGDAMDLTGLQVMATYTDGTSGLIEDYIVTGFDTDTKGNKVMTLNKGAYTVDIPYTVNGTQCTGIEIETAPVYTNYYVGQRFSLAAFEAVAQYSNGLTMTLTDEDCEFYIGEKKIDASYRFTKDDVGEHVVTVKHAPTDTIDASDGEASFNITVEDYTLSGIIMGNMPTNTTYAPGDEVNPAGMTVRGVYTNATGESRYALLEDDEYEVLPADTSEIGTATVTVRCVYDPTFTTTFNVSVVEKRPVMFMLEKYPRTTYQVGENFTTDGMKAGILYTNDDLELTDAYTVDLSNFDNTTPGVTTVRIVPNDTSLQAVELSVTITEEKTHFWKSVAFGASATASSNPITEILDENGNVDSVNVRSWNGAGKITADQDGIAYYYTRVDGTKNFTVSADILVNDYLEHDNNDEQRNGQEAFGIMARDVIPLIPDPDKLEDGDATDMTVKTDKALLDENGEPIPNNIKLNFSSNMVIAGGYSGTSWPTDPTALSYEKNTKINRINLVMRTGVYSYDAENSNIEKVGPFAVSETFPARGNRYRVTLTKINGGMYASCYDYQTGKEMETYQYFTDDRDLSFLTTQNEDTIYVGFFAARWADITVSNIDLHETDPATDPITSNQEDSLTTPAIALQSSAYSTVTNYNLSLKVTNRLGGLVTVQQNGKVIYRDEPISKSSSLPVTLEPNSVNKFTVLYKPNASDTITSTDEIVTTFDVTHRDRITDYDVLYCSPDGTVDGDGTRENPLDVYSAVGFVDMGKEVIALEGTYKMTKAFAIPLANTGAPGHWKTLRADDGATVIFDMQDNYEGMTLDGYYWHIKGIDFTNSGDNLKPFLLAGNHCLIEDCNFYDNGDTGFQISRSSDSNINVDQWPAYNVIKDCESYNNCDPSKINADGFGLKLTVGYGNIFQRCISHNNLDDGYDAYTKMGTGAIGPVTLEECVSYDNGNYLNPDGSTTSYNGGGNNGFKMGGESVSVQHYLKDCIAFENGANGITTNANPAIKIRNFISYKNGGRGFYLYTSTDSSRRNYNYDLEGCVSYLNASGDDVQADDFVANGETVGADGIWPVGGNHSATPIISESNYWEGTNSLGETITDDFFKSVDKSVSLTNGRYSKDANGEFILGDFLARVDEYVHDEEDIVNYPENPSDVTTENTTESTTSTTTETTTKAPSSSGGSSSSSSGGSGSSSHKASGTAVETTTVTDTENVTETTTEAKYFVTPSGVVVTPPTEGVYSVNFTDIASRAWAVESINKLASAGIVSGVSSTSFAPDAYSKRADFIVMLVKTLGLTDSTNDNFDDVATGSYYADALAIAKAAGIATGYGDGNFGPESTITRQDMMVLVANALEFAGVELNTDTSVLDSFADADQIAEYAKPYVAALVNLGLASGTDNGIEPTALITRAQMSVLIANVYDLVLDTAESYMAAQETVTEETTEATTESEEDTTVSDEETTEAVTDEASTEETTEMVTDEVSTEETTEAE